MNTNASLPLWAIATIAVAAIVGIVAIIVLTRRKKSN
jgi:hypothetical protein